MTAWLTYHHHVVLKTFFCVLVLEHSAGIRSPGGERPRRVSLRQAGPKPPGLDKTRDHLDLYLEIRTVVHLLILFLSNEDHLIISHT